MHALRTHRGIIVPFERANIDTDLLLPKQYLKSLEAEGFGGFLFDNERYLDPGELDTPPKQRRPNPEFILNRAPWDRASVLLAEANFGCGSSREHAVWALRDFGIRVLIAPSFGDIFLNNCFNNGLLPIILAQDVVNTLFAQVESMPGVEAEIDVQNRKLRVAELELVFELDSGRQHNLLAGIDPIGESLTMKGKITQYETRRRELEPWIFR